MITRFEKRKQNKEKKKKDAEAFICYDNKAVDGIILVDATPNREIDNRFKKNPWKKVILLILNFSTSPTVSGKEISQLHRRQYSTSIYFNDFERMKSKIDLGRIWTQNLKTGDEMISI